MDRLLFGISGIPLGNNEKKFNYKSGINYLSSLNLDAMELPFVRSVNITDKNKDEVLSEKNSNNFYLSAHGSYYINLNADEKEKQEKSIERIINGANALKKVGGNRLIFHPGYYLKDTKIETFKTIIENLASLPDIGVEYRLETTGKPTQFGDLEELVSICKEVKTCKLCIDFSHLHARYNGSLKEYKDFYNVLSYIEKNLSYTAIEDIHIHMAGINYGLKGEKNHLPFLESDFNYKACLKALKDFNAKGVIICESPLLEHDALLLKETYMCL